MVKEHLGLGFLITILLSVKHQVCFPNFVYGECVYNANSNRQGFSLGFMETRLAVTHRKDNCMFPLYDTSLNLLPQILADWLDDALVRRTQHLTPWPKTMLWDRHCWSGLQKWGRFYRILSSFPCVCGVAGRNILQGCRCFWQRVTDLFRCCILQSGPVNRVCLVLLYMLWKTGRISNSGLIKP